MASYIVTYNADYLVEADSEDEAIELAIEKHFKAPDGSWEAELDGPTNS